MDTPLELKLNLEHYKRSTICGIILLSLISSFICIVVAFTSAPSIMSGSSLKYVECDQGHRFQCFLKTHENNTIFFKVNLKTYNQIFYLIAEPFSESDISKKVNYDLKIDSRSGEETLKTWKKTNKTLDFSCDDGKCDTELLFYIPFIKYKSYIVQVSIMGEIPVERIDFSIKFITEDFTKFFLGVKSFFLAISILNLIFFAIGMYQVGFKLWPRESCLVFAMGISLFVFNEPFLALTLQRLTPGWSGVSVVCNSQFVCMVLVFWFLVLHNDMLQLPWTIVFIVESIVVFIFFVLMNVVYMYTTVELKFDPSFSWQHDLPQAKKKIFIAIITFLVIFTLWIIVLVVRALIKIKEKSLRQRFLVASVIFMLLVTIVLIGVGAFQPIPRSGGLMLLTVSLYNIYFTVLLWLLRPSRSAFNLYKEQANRQNVDDSTVKGNNAIDLAEITINDPNPGNTFNKF